MMNEKLLAELYEKYVNGICTAAEKKKLMELLADPSLEAAQERLIEHSFDNLPIRYPMPAYLADQVFGRMMSAHRLNTARRKRRAILSWTAVAASLLLLALAGNWFFNKTPAPRMANTAGPTQHPDVPPPSANRASIVLANGQIIFLDSAGNGTLATEGNVHVVKSGNGEISYRADVAGGEANLYNTLRNPRGSRVLSLKLSDGTRVWLNAESTLRYPAAFDGASRKVDITGEAYFEVAHDAKTPFIVAGGGTEIRVLGTSFNVNAYAEQEDVRVTLLDGAVNVLHDGASHRLQPGQQARVGHTIQVVNDVNLEQAVAWKNGFFLFQGAALHEVMQQLSRWYDVDISYTGKIPERHFVGKVDREYTLSEVLAVLGASDVHYTIEGRRLIIQP